MKQPDHKLQQHYNRILDLQISIIQGYQNLINRAAEYPSTLIDQVQRSHSERRLFKEQLESAIVSGGDKIDKRTGVVATPHDVAGDNHQSSLKGLAELNEELLVAYEEILNHPELSEERNTTLTRQRATVEEDRKLLKELERLS